MKIITIFYCFLYATWTAADNIYVVGVEREEVTFRSTHKLAWKNDKYFCRDPCKGSEDILVTVKYGETVQSGRITLVDWRNGTITVSISQVQLSDAGTYWCGVDRPGLDTFTAVTLTVKKSKEAATVPPGVSPKRTTRKILRATQLISEMDTSGPSYVSTTSNSTERAGGNSSSGTVLYASVGAVSILILLVLATTLSRCRKISKAQPRVCSSSDREVDGDDVDKETSPEGTSCALLSNLDPPTSAATPADNAPSHIYENIDLRGGKTDSRQSAANVQRDHGITSRIYIKPLPPTVPE
ncbi:CMRF35-like molecule 5 [Anabas testudineus]|uniref:CMRF35-like molecule 5 n=1 Tax=Anabas testudineus TaxID=64144 RepID=UPI000E457057|nr:CMRF35-like molecule 5 [Anabas testudineus]